MKLEAIPDRELLALFGQTMEELRRRGITRSSNSPVADYAESLCARALGLALNTKSTAGFDGTDLAGRRVEVKARRLTARNASRQLSSLRNLEAGHFDALAGVLFAADFRIERAALIPIAIVRAHSKFVPHTNSWRFLLRDRIWAEPGVEDITSRLREVQQ